MNEAMFTPGPWEVVYRDDESCMQMTVITPKGLMMPTSNEGQLDFEQDEKLEKVIAITYHQLKPIVGYDASEKDEEDANAHLIAAAPEMYAALEKFKKQLNRALTCTTEEELGKAVEWICGEGKTLIDEVLLKAQGGTPE